MTEKQNIVVLDSNILCNTPFLQAEALQSFSDHAVERRIKVVVPEVVVMETVNVVRRTWEEELGKVSGFRINACGIANELEAVTSAVSAKIASYENDLRLRLSTLGFDIVPVPDVPHIEIARRASESVAPYLPKSSKENYRDTLIWLTVLDVAESNPDDVVWFLSENHKDFGHKATQSSRNDRFTVGLLQELTERGLTGRVRYSTDLFALEQHFASEWEPIDSAELAARSEMLSMSILSESLSRTLVGFPLDPDQTGMSDSVIRAHIIGAAAQLDGWSFHEAAGRGEKRWTAKFIVPIEVDISTIESATTNEFTKTLNISGVVTVEADGTPTALSIVSAIALPGDEAQERAERRTARAERRLNESAVVSGLGKSFTINPDLVSGLGKSFTINPDLVSGLGKSFTINPDLVSGLGKSVTINPDLVSGLGKSVTINPDLVSGLGKSVTIDPSMVSGLGKSVTIDPSMVSGLGKSVTIDPSMVSGLGKSVTIDPSMVTGLGKRVIPDARTESPSQSSNLESDQADES
ncbi:PIN domain-containing protein [Rhodococcus sp. GB-02]